MTSFEGGNRLQVILTRTSRGYLQRPADFVLLKPSVRDGGQRFVPFGIKIKPTRIAEIVQEIFLILVGMDQYPRGSRSFLLNGLEDRDPFHGQTFRDFRNFRKPDPAICQADRIEIQGEQGNEEIDSA